MAEHEQVTKSSPFWATKLDLDGILEGFPIIYGNRDLDGEVTVKGSCAKSIAENVASIDVAFDHHVYAGHTLRMEEVGRDDLPQAVKSRFPDATGGVFAAGQLGRTGAPAEFMRAESERIRKGRGSGLSYFADVLRRDGPNLVELRVREWGAQLRNTAINPAAWSTSMKGAADPLGTLFADAGLPTDEDWIEFVAKAGRMFSAKNLAEMETAHATLGRLIAMAKGDVAGGDADEKLDAAKGRPSEIYDFERERLALLRLQLLEA